MSRSALITVVAVIAVITALRVAPAAAAPDGTAYTLFESGQARPLALSPDGKSLAALNTPDNRVELFAIGAGGRLMPRGSVAVGYEPVALAWRDGRELWVVNHVSDSVSVVRLDLAVLRGGAGPVGQVVRTLLVGDEPADIAFAGPNRSRAFITSARRGQNVTPAALGARGVDPALTTPGVGRAIVWVYAADGEAESVGGTPLTRIELFTDSPRALAVSPDGSRVFAAGFRTGNRTASVPAQVWRNSGWVQEELAGVPQQAMSLLVRLVGDRWLTHDGLDFTDKMRFTLPDEDVFVIDAMAPVPRALPGAVYAGVGTVLYGMAVNPQNGNVYVVNTDARNHAGDEQAVRCDATRNRVTVLTPGGQVHPRELDTHLPTIGDRCAVPGAVADLSLAIPSAITVAPDGRRAFLTALGADALAIVDTERLESDRHRTHADDIVRLTGGGPTGVVHHPLHDVAYVLTRFDDGISVVDVSRRAEVQHLRMHSPEPPAVTRGRRLLFDARRTSRNGQMACASCHVFAHTDHLGWDLGNRDAEVLPTMVHPFIPEQLLPGLMPRLEESIYVHQQLKGVMVTQSLRGLDNHGPMHWRGDRYDERVWFPTLRPSVQPDLGLFDERAAFRSFNGTFVSLHGLDAELPDADMEALTEYVMRLTYPPNAIRNLDDSLTPQQARGRARYFDHERPADAIGPCIDCHVLDRRGNAEFGVARPGFFGTDGRITFDALPQLFKVPHLRNLYEKAGMFGTAKMLFIQENPLFVDDFGRDFEAFAHFGRQIRGFGFAHDGSLDAVQRYLNAIPFRHRPPEPEEIPFVGDVEHVGIAERETRDDLAAFIMAYPGNLAPIVAQQLTVSDRNLAAAAARLTLLVQRHDAGDCELVVRRVLGGRECGFYYLGGGLFVDDRGVQIALLGLLRDLATSPLTFTCTAPGDGRRLALDRDQDALLDGTELELGSDPQDPRSPGRIAAP
ncbi:MAG: hypothetical protein R3F65_23530 [bacterium]